VVGGTDLSTFVSANNALTTLASAINAIATTVVVATGTGILFPSLGAGEIFAITLTPAGNTSQTPNEIMYVTAVTGDSFTVVRGQEGTTAVSWVVGSSVQNLWTTGQMEALVQQSQLQVQATNFATDTGTANVGVITLSPIPVSLSSLQGSPIRVLKMGANNTAAYTLNINGLGAIPVYFQGAVLPANALLANQLFEVFYDGVVLELLSVPGSINDGAAGGDLTGNYPDPVVNTNKITNAKLAQAPPYTVKSNLTGSTANDADNTLIALLEAMGAAAAVLSNPGQLTIPAFVSGNLVPVTIQWFNTGPMDYGPPGVTWNLPYHYSNACLFATAGTLSDSDAGDSADEGMVQVLSYSATQVVVFCHAFGSAPTGHPSGLILAIGY
jgi:hypothetical protein